MTEPKPVYFVDEIGILPSLADTIHAISALNIVCLSEEGEEHPRWMLEDALQGVEELKLFFAHICEDCYDIDREVNDLERLARIIEGKLEAMPPAEASGPGE